MLDARKLPTDPDELAETLKKYTAFGRVRPDQKRAMVRALQSRGDTVAMTGDGVNDVLALKDADIGVAMGAGSSAARAVAQIVLLDNKFATLPYVVGEGRRVIGNIERVSNLFLTKTVYSVLLALLIGVTGLGAKALGVNALMFPFQPIQVTTAAWFTIGIPAFILSLAPNNERAQAGFVRRVMTAAVPNGAVVGIATFACYLLAFRGAAATPAQQMQASTSALITLLVIAVWVLAVVARPYSWWRVVLVALSGTAYVVIFSIPLRARAIHARSLEHRVDRHRAGDRFVRRCDRRSTVVVARLVGRRTPSFMAPAERLIRWQPAPGGCESGECGFRAGFRTEPETAAGNRDRRECERNVASTSQSTAATVPARPPQAPHWYGACAPCPSR